jgi:hypothetical protein
VSGRPATCAWANANSSRSPPASALTVVWASTLPIGVGAAASVSQWVSTQMTPSMSLARMGVRWSCLPKAAVVGVGLGGVTARRNCDRSRPFRVGQAADHASERWAKSTPAPAQSGTVASSDYSAGSPRGVLNTADYGHDMCCTSILASVAMGSATPSGLRRRLRLNATVPTSVRGLVAASTGRGVCAAATSCEPPASSNRAHLQRKSQAAKLRRRSGQSRPRS